MGLNFLNLGVSFGANTKGLARGQNIISKGFKRAKSGVEAVSSAFGHLGENQKQYGTGIEDNHKILESFKVASKTGLRDVGKVWQWVRGTATFFFDVVGKGASIIKKFADLTVGTIVGKVQKAFDALVNSSTNLTTAYENLLIQSQKTASASLASMGMYKDLNKNTAKATSMHLAQNTSLENNAKALRDVKFAKEQLAATGLTSPKDIAKLREMGVVSDANVEALREMGQLYNLNKKQISGVTKQWVIAGQRMGDMQGALGLMGELLPNLRAQAGAMGGDVSKNLAMLQESAARTAGTMRQAGMSVEQVKQTVMALSTAQRESTEGFRKMISGVERKFPAALQESTIATQSMNKAFDMLQKTGPAGFSAAMLDMVKSMREGKVPVDRIRVALGFMRDRLGAFMGPDISEGFMQFIDKLSTMSKRQLDAMNSTKGMAESLKDLTKAYKSGLTAAVRFDRAMQSGMKGFRDITRANIKHLTKDSRDAFKRFNNAARKSTGVAKVLVDTMSEMHQVGILALFPKGVQPELAVAQTMLKEMGPHLQTLGQLGFSPKDILSPLGLITTGWAGYTLMVEKAGDSHLQSIKGWEKLTESEKEYHRQVGRERAKKQMKKWVDDSLDTLESLTEKFPKIAKEIVAKMEGAIAGTGGNGWGSKIVRIMSNIWQGLKPLANMFGRFIKKAIFTAFGVTSWTEIGKKFVSALWDGFKSGLSYLWENFRTELMIYLGGRFLWKAVPMAVAQRSQAALINGFSRGVGSPKTIGAFAKTLTTSISKVSIVGAAGLGAAALGLGVFIGTLINDAVAKATSRDSKSRKDRTKDAAALGEDFLSDMTEAFRRNSATRINKKEMVEQLLEATPWHERILPIAEKAAEEQVDRMIWIAKKEAGRLNKNMKSLQAKESRRAFVGSGLAWYMPGAPDTDSKGGTSKVPKVKVPDHVSVDIGKSFKKTPQHARAVTVELVKMAEATKVQVVPQLTAANVQLQGFKGHADVALRAVNLFMTSMKTTVQTGSDEVVRSFQGMWEQITTDTSMAVVAMSTELDKLLSKLMKVNNVASTQAAAARGPSVQAKQRTSSALERVAKTGDWQAELIDATHNPAWAQDYQTVFMAKMDALLVAVEKSSKEGGAAPRRGSLEGPERGGKKLGQKKRK